MLRWEYINDSSTFTQIVVGSTIMSVSPHTSKLFNASPDEELSLYDLPEPWPCDPELFAVGAVKDLCHPAHH